MVETEDCAEMHEYINVLPNVRLIEYAPDMSVGDRYKAAAGLATGMNIVFLYDWALPYASWLAALGSTLEESQNAAVVQPFLEKHDGGLDQESLKICGGCFMISSQILQAIG